jgi:hypothetical protein
VTTKEAFALACETIERKLGETARKWGYTVEKDSDASWACWQIAELGSAKLVSIMEFKSFLCLEILTDETAAIFPNCFLPKDIEAAVERYASRALKVAVLRLAYKELRGILGLDDVRVRGGLSIVSKDFVESELRVCINQKTFYITFRLNKKCWSWKVTTFKGEPVTTIRRPLGENPIPVLCETVKCFGLLLL